ncbi:hypothetical protein KJ780_03850 [Candidatus Micrarchaeota archaeon]|nr:hypothetical protein [Candidatus Micrarchaeota archaeon]
MGVKEDLDKAFRGTFSLIFGECNIGMEELEKYLMRDNYPLGSRKSAISGKEVIISNSVSSPLYCKSAKFILPKERQSLVEKTPTLDLNKIKDIDSILESLEEIFYYEGSRITGNSNWVDKSDNVSDSFYVYKAHDVSKSRYVAYSSSIRDNSDHVFGCAWFLRSKYLIRAFDADSLTRCFETYMAANCSDLFFSYNCMNCNDLMFSFNQRSKRNMIGNLQLEKSKYMELRKKLIEESRQYIEKHKEFPSMFELSAPKTIPRINVHIKNKEYDFKKLDDAFRTTCRIVLGKEIGGLAEYEKYLIDTVVPVRRMKTPFGNETVHSDMFFFQSMPNERIANIEESRQLATISIELGPNETISLNSILEKINNIAFFCAEVDEGANINNMETFCAYNSSNTYKVGDATFTKNAACCTLAHNSENVFGCQRAVHSKFSIRCHGCNNVSSSFELDGCANCISCYFCHNSENLTECMFCFNAKSLRYAIGNKEIGKEAYMKIKKLVLDEITKKLEKDKKLNLNIFNVGCRGK